jgi:RNA polymerase sigma-70 factor (ECF subfamily)
MDRDLVEQARRGDREAFGILARTRGDRLFGIARRILRDIDLAEDAVQQTLVIAWRELPRLRDPDRFDVWLQRTLVHACYAEARRKRLWTANIRVLPVDGPAGPDEIGALVDRDEIERGFRRLPPEQRAILVLHHYLGLGLNEIGEVLAIPAGTARSRLHYAHRAMRALLEADARPTAVAGGRSS